MRRGSRASPSPPSVFPLVSCESPLSDENQVAVGCLAQDFLPSSISFSWNYKNRSEVSQGITTFPTQQKGGKYVATSQVLLPSRDIVEGTDDYLVCKVKHGDHNKDLHVHLPEVREQPPTVTVFMPPRDAFFGTSKSSLICQATGFSPKQITVSWLRDGKPVMSGFTTEEVRAEIQESGPRTFSIVSQLTITQFEWLGQSVFTCRVDHKGLTFMKNVSSTCNVGPSTDIQVFATPPSFADIFLTKSAKLSCLVTDMATSETLNISWTRQNGEALPTNLTNVNSHPNGTFSRRGEASVCVEDWESGERFTCTVTHTDLPSPVKQTISKPRDVAKHPPAVYLLPPAREQLVLRESATISCLVKAFSPPDVFVRWLQGGKPLSSDKYVTSPPVPEPQAPGLYFTHSLLTVPEEDWNSGEIFTCVVAHQALPFMVTERNVDKSTGKPTLYNVSLIMSDTANTCY